MTTLQLNIGKGKLAPQAGDLVETRTGFVGRLERVPAWHWNGGAWRVVDKQKTEQPADGLCGLKLIFAAHPARQYRRA